MDATASEVLRYEGNGRAQKAVVVVAKTSDSGEKLPIDIKKGNQQKNGKVVHTSGISPAVTGKKRECTQGNMPAQRVFTFRQPT
jgi:hypothetical protein